MVDFTGTWSGLVPHLPELLGEKTDDDKHHIIIVEEEVVRLGNTLEFFTTDPNLLSISHSVHLVRRGCIP